MIDKDKIKEEIERRIESINSCPFRTAELGSEKIEEGELSAYNSMLQFIDSLPEEHNEDLEEEIENWIKTKHFVFTEIDEVIKTAKHFAEWQEKQMLGIAEAFYEQGRHEQKQQMMKDAIECIVEDWCGDSPEITIPLNPQDFKMGDKVKIKICKTE